MGRLNFFLLAAAAYAAGILVFLRYACVPPRRAPNPVKAMALSRLMVPLCACATIGCGVMGAQEYFGWFADAPGKQLLLLFSALGVMGIGSWRFYRGMTSLFPDFMKRRAPSSQDSA